MTDDMAMCKVLTMQYQHQFADHRSIGDSIGFTRLAMLLASNAGSLPDALLQSKQFAESTPRVGLVLKAAVAAGTTTDPAWAGALVDHRKLSSEFLKLVRPRSILGRLQGLRRVPFQTRTLRSGVAAGAGWVVQGAPVPVRKLDLESVFLAQSRVSALIVVTSELVRFWSSANESNVQDEMVAGVAAFMDRAFIDPAMAAVVDEAPASITHGIGAIHSSGSSVAAISADVEAMALSLIAAGSDLQTAAWVLHPRTALSLSLRRDGSGALAFPYVTVLGGSLLGLPVLVSAAVPIQASPATTIIALIDGAHILLADDDLATIDTSGYAAVQMEDDPVTGAAPVVSLWQAGCTGIRVDRYVRWRAADAAAVAVLDGVAY